MPFSVHDNVDHPISLYAATKKSNELMAHTYSHLFRLPTTGLRFFTVYGPWGRPDMAIFLFTRAILEGRPIEVFNNGQMKRDFTYVDDIAEGVCAPGRPSQPDPHWRSDAPDPGSSSAPYRLYNIGNNQPVALLTSSSLEQCLGRKAQMNFLPMQPGDVPETFADIEDLTAIPAFVPPRRWPRASHALSPGIANTMRSDGAGSGSGGQDSKKPRQYIRDGASVFARLASLRT